MRRPSWSSPSTCCQNPIRPLELPQNDRWAAGLYGKVRDHSKALRDGLCETLGPASSPWKTIYSRAGVLELIVEQRVVASLIERLLTPLTIERLMSQEDDFPRYAEAAPNAFLTLIERDLQQAAACFARSPNSCTKWVCSMAVYELGFCGHWNVWPGIRRIFRVSA